MLKKITHLVSCFFFFILCASFSFSQDINFISGFEDEHWYQQWGLDRNPRNVSLIENDADIQFQKIDGKALKIQVEKDGHYGTSFEYKFKQHHHAEPEEIFFRYHIRLAGDWNPAQGGKLPGIAATYSKAGWGGRPVHGDDGWSARGLFKGRINGFTPIGFYAYQMDMKGQYGSNWLWDMNDFKGLENNRWYAIEQHIKLNTPGQPNGIARAWVNDVLVFEKKDARFRSINQLKIETVWINVYHGGKWTAKSNQHLFIDNVVIKSSKIGSANNTEEH